MSDAELVIQLKNGSSKAFDMIYHRYVKPLYAYCFPYLKSHEMTEEVVHDVFLNLWRYRDRLDPGYELSSLLFTVARRYRINALRSVINEPIFEDFIDYQNDLSHSDSSQLEYDELKRRVLELASRLPSTQKKVFLLSRFRHKTVQEIAEELNLTEKTIHNQLSLALKTLKQQLLHS